MTWDSQREAWQRLPVDDGGGYRRAEDLLALPDTELRALVARMEGERYQGWRNSGNLWRQHMGHTSVHGRRVLDYGCGTGIEALQHARNGNEVSVADINAASTQLAARVLRLHGFAAAAAYVIGPDQRLPGAPDRAFDLVVMSGVLHHIEDPAPAAAEAHRVVAARGELRVLVYTDLMWRLAAGTDPPQDVHGDPGRPQFVRLGDPVGEWADWYDTARLQDRLGRWFTLREWHYIAPGHPAGPGLFGVGILERKP